MTNVIPLAKIKDDNQLISIEEMLKMAFDDLKTWPERKPKKALLLLLNDDDNFYIKSYYASKLHTSEMVSLCEVHKNQCLDILRGINVP